MEALKKERIEALNQEFDLKKKELMDGFKEKQMKGALNESRMSPSKTHSLAVLSVPFSGIQEAPQVATVLPPFEPEVEEVKELEEVMAKVELPYPASQSRRVSL